MNKSNFFRQLRGFFWTSLKMQLRNKTSLFFSFFFPVLFIVSFGFFDTQVKEQYDIGLLKSESVAYFDLKDPLNQSKPLKTEISNKPEELQNKLEKNEIDAILEFGDNSLTVITNIQKKESADIVFDLVNNVVVSQSLEHLQIEPKWEVFDNQQDLQNTRYIDYALPGILAFAIITRAISGISFNFVVMRKKGSLKRLFAAPVNKTAFIVGQASSKVVFIILQILLLAGLGYWLFDVTIANGLGGLLEILAISILGIAAFLAVGYIIAGNVKSEESINPINTLIIYPQIILAGTFFSIKYFPEDLQKIAEFLPLYNLNEGLRLVYLDGYNIYSNEVAWYLFYLFVWVVLLYFIAIKTFRFKN